MGKYPVHQCKDKRNQLYSNIYWLTLDCELRLGKKLLNGNEI